MIATRARPFVIALLAFGLALGPGIARAAPSRQSYALFRLDPLGISPEIVDQLERILRVELERVLGQKLPSRQAVEQVTRQSRKLSGCTADPACLQPLARALKATRVVAGNVGGLADSYVVNLKLVDVEGARELRRVSVTLRGSPEELIDEIRVAAYRLVAPERMVGAIAVLSDVPDATVTLDGNPVGQTPIAQPLTKIPVGVHHLLVTREGFSPYAEDVPVRFEKTTKVVVHQDATSLEALKKLRRARETPVYARWWFWSAIAAGAVVTGLAIGFGVPHQGAIDCARGGCP